MKRLYTLVILCALLALTPVPAMAKGDAIDISRSQVSIIGPTTIEIRNITVTGYQGTYKATFEWNADHLAFDLIQASEDTSVPTGSWTVTVMYNMASQLAIRINRNADRTFEMDVMAAVGVPFFFPEKVAFSQNGKTFYLTMSSGGVNDAAALYSPTGGWSGTGQIDPGLTYTSTISNMPSWFNPLEPFTFQYDKTKYTLK